MRVLLSAAGYNIDEFTGREEGLTSRNFFDGKKHPQDDNFLSFSFRFSMPEKEKNSRFFFLELTISLFYYYVSNSLFLLN